MGVDQDLTVSKLLSCRRWLVGKETRSIPSCRTDPSLFWSSAFKVLRKDQPSRASILKTIVWADPGVTTVAADKGTGNWGVCLQTEWLSSSKWKPANGKGKGIKTPLTLVHGGWWVGSWVALGEQHSITVRSEPPWYESVTVTQKLFLPHVPDGRGMWMCTFSSRYRNSSPVRIGAAASNLLDPLFGPETECFLCYS